GALEPLSAPVAVELMSALAAGGDRAGAIRHAAVYETLLRSELDTPPDRAVAALAHRLRGELVAADLAPADAGHPATSASPAHAGPTGWKLPIPAPPSRRWTRAGIGVIALGLLGAAAIRARHLRAPAVPDATLVVLGAIEGPDSGLTLAVREALRLGLGDEPNIRLLGETGIRESLRLMERPAETRLTGLVAAEVALRRGAAFAVVGSVVRVGTGMQIVAEALDPRTGDALLVVSERPTSEGDAVPAIGRIGQRLRRQALGSTRSARSAP